MRWLINGCNMHETCCSFTVGCEHAPPSLDAYLRVVHGRPSVVKSMHGHSFPRHRNLRPNVEAPKLHKRSVRSVKPSFAISSASMDNPMPTNRILLSLRIDAPRWFTVQPQQLYMWA